MNLKDKFGTHIGAKGSFRRNSLIMSSGAMVNIAIAFILTPIVTRIYSKEEFGVFYIYASIVAIGSLIINGMYPHAFVIPKFKKDFLSLLKLCLVSTFIFTFLFYVFLLAGGASVLSIIGGDKLINYAYLIPLGLMLVSLNIIFVNWNVRRKEFKKNATSNVGLSASDKVMQISYGSFVNGTFPGLIYSHLISQFIATLILSGKGMVKDLLTLQRITFQDMKGQAKEFKKYPTYLLGSNFVNRFTADIPLYILSSFYGAGAVGAFGFASAMLNIPYNVIGNSIALVYFQRANELYLNDVSELKAFTLRTYDKMLFLGTLAFGFIFSFGDIIFSIVFSSSWKLAGQIAMLLSVFYVFKLISSPFARIFRVVRKEEIILKVNISLAVFRVIGITIGLLFNNLLIAIGFFSFGSLLGYAFINIEVFKVVKIEISHILKRTAIIIVPIFVGFYVLRLLLLPFIQSFLN